MIIATLDNRIICFGLVAASRSHFGPIFDMFPDVSELSEYTTYTLTAVRLS